jgi:hypothetical protein
MFQHDVLHPRNREFRLFRIAPSIEPQEQIILELRHASISEDEAHFAALSYLWGDITNMIDSQVNGEPFPLGHNLHAALKQLRQNGVRSWLWVDFICINQSDLKEKSWHVNDMHNIYSRANTVYMWLGPASDETNKAMDFVSRVGPKALAVGFLDLGPDRPLPKEIRDYIRTSLPSNQVDQIDDSKEPDIVRFLLSIVQEDGLQRNANPQDDLCGGIRNLLTRDYWHRVWVIQEVALAKDAFVLCGEKIVPLDVFDATFTAVWHCMRSDILRLRPNCREFCWGISRTLYTIKAMATRRNRRCRKRVRLADVLVEVSAAPERPFYSASDPRDIAFGLLGVSDDMEKQGLSADYNMTLAEVFTELTRVLIRDGDANSGSFHLDRCVPRQEAVDNLPTWVPDWRMVGKYGLKVFPTNYHRVFDATANMMPPLLTTKHVGCNNAAVLRRSGCLVDVVTEVMQPPRWIQRNEWDVSRIADGHAWLSTVFEFAGLGPETGPGEDFVWRTIMRDRLDGINRPNSRELKPVGAETAWLIRKILRRERIDESTLTEDQVEFIQSGPFDFSRSLPKLEKLGDQISYIARHWPESLGSSSRGRTLFKTAKGMLGLGHVAVRAGDKVTLLWGVRSPLVLRPRDGEGSDKGFELMGDAYVDGIMHGEFLDTKPKHEEFDIY